MVRPFVPPGAAVATSAVAIMCTLLAGCGPSYSPDTYASSAVQQASKVEQGVIAGVREVVVEASGTTGAVVGGAAGGIAGSQVAGGGLGTALTSLGGSLVGGLVGTGIERAAGDTTAFEYIVRKTNNELVSVTQKDEVPMALGQHVLVIAGSQARIVPDYTVQLEAPKPLGAKPEPAKPEPLKPEPPKQPSATEGAPQASSPPTSTPPSSSPPSLSPTSSSPTSSTPQPSATQPPATPPSVPPPSVP